MVVFCRSSVVPVMVKLKIRQFVPSKRCSVPKYASYIVYFFAGECNIMKTRRLLCPRLLTSLAQIWNYVVGDSAAIPHRWNHP